MLDVIRSYWYWDHWRRGIDRRVQTTLDNQEAAAELEDGASSNNNENMKIIFLNE